MDSDINFGRFVKQNSSGSEKDSVFRFSKGFSLSGRQAASSSSGVIPEKCVFLVVLLALVLLVLFSPEHLSPLGVFIIN